MEQLGFSLPSRDATHPLTKLMLGLLALIAGLAAVLLVLLPVVGIIVSAAVGGMILALAGVVMMVPFLLVAATVLMFFSRSSARRHTGVRTHSISRWTPSRYEPRGVRGGAGMIAGILLAAGAGTRFGGRKLLHPLPDGIPVGVAALRNLKASLPHAIAVIRPGDDELRDALAREYIRTIECAEAGLGMGHSLAAGVAAASRADGWVIALGDMPRIRPETILAVAEALEQGAEIVVPVFAGERGHPVGISRRFRDALLGLTGDSGARGILKANAHAVLRLEVDDPAVLQDIDTRADAERMDWPQIR
jgi:molybdenum cofactor cytidylyltransferase